MKNNFDINEDKFPEGHFVGVWMGIGMAVCSGLGVTICVITDNFGLIGVGPALGVAIGLSIGQSIENKYNKVGRIRPLTEPEKRKQKIVLAVGIALFTLGVLVLLLRYFRN